MVFQGNYQVPAAAAWIADPAADEIPAQGLVAAAVTDRQWERRLLELENRLGSRLLIPEVWRNILSTAGLLISSAISGGSFSQRVLDAQTENPDRCWLLLEPLSMEFSLPCPTGCGTPISGIPREQPQFFSRELCCQYTYNWATGAMILYDTEETLRQKIQLAKDAGFLGVVSLPGPETHLENPREPC